jgi:hypothetical protein
MRNIVSDPQFLSERAEMMLHFQDIYYKPEETEIIHSPSNNFKLEIHYFCHEEDIRRYNYTQGIIKDKDSNIIDIIYRNYGAFPYKWAELNDDEYLLCGLDYQGYSIVNLSNKETNHYVPEDAYKGHGFCWAEIRGSFFIC